MHYRKSVELLLGRKLARREHVHHIDGNHANNELSNLRVLDCRDHSRIHNRWVERNGKLVKVCRECGAKSNQNPGSVALCRTCIKREKAKYAKLHLKLPAEVVRDVGHKVIEAILENAKTEIIAAFRWKNHVKKPAATGAGSSASENQFIRHSSETKRAAHAQPRKNNQTRKSNPLDRARGRKE